MKLFLTGFTQVFLVAINTYFISQLFYSGIGIVAFLISFVWCFNVGKVSTGTLTDKLIYSLGASVGSLSGVYLSSFII